MNCLNGRHQEGKATDDATSGRHVAVITPRLHWYQFRLRSLLVLMTAASVCLAYLSVLFSRYEQEFQAACELRNTTGLFVEHDASSRSVMRWLFSVALGRDYRPVTCLGPTMDHLFFLKIDKDKLAPIRHLRNLRELDLGSSKVTEEALEHVGGLSNLEFIILHNNAITGEVFRGWDGLVKLRKLYLVNTPVHDTTLAYLQSMTSLEELVLTGTQITDDGLKHLCRLPALIALDLSGQAITDKGLLYLRQMKSLQRLYLDNTQVTQRGIDGLRKALPNLEIEVSGLKSQVG